MSVEIEGYLLFISIPRSHGATDSFSFADLRMVSGSGSECLTIAPYSPYSAIIVLRPQHFSVFRHLARRFWNHTCGQDRGGRNVLGTDIDTWTWNEHGLRILIITGFFVWLLSRRQKSHMEIINIAPTNAHGFHQYVHSHSSPPPDIRYNMLSWIALNRIKIYTLQLSCMRFHPSSPQSFARLKRVRID